MYTAPYDLMRLRRAMLALALILVIVGLTALGWRLWTAQTVRAVGPYTVNSTGDAPDANTGDGKCETRTPGECTLRAAIEQANADGGATTINITAIGVITLGSSLPTINTDLTIVGPGAGRLTIDGADSYQPFSITFGKTVVISDLTLTRGRSYWGGAVYKMMGTLTISACTVSYNTATGSGGGIYNYGGALVVKASTISGNVVTSTYGNGGGIYNDTGGNLTIEASVISGNVVANTSGGGGGIYNSGSVLAIHDGILSGNQAYNGGGLYLSYSNADLTNNVVTDNRANGAGSGIYIAGAAPRLRHTTIARNTGGDGSGVYVTGSSTPALTNTILVNQTVGITVTGGNSAILNDVLWYSNAVNTAGAGTITVTNAYAGNPAFAPDGYHLTPVSAAIDRGVSTGVTTDMDGDPRPQDKGYDLGADEFRGARILVSPGGGWLVYTDAHGLITTIQVTPGAVADVTMLAYGLILSPTEPVSPGLRFAGHTFDLDAYRNDQLLPGFTFEEGRTVTITIHYSDDDVMGLYEPMLKLYRWVSPGWEVIGARSGEGQELDPVNNVLTAWLRGLSRFSGMSMGASQYEIFLPLVVRSG